MAKALASTKRRDFWAEIRKVTRHSKGVSVPILDGVSGDSTTSCMWASKLSSLYNSRSGIDESCVSNSISGKDVSRITINFPWARFLTPSAISN